MGTIERNCRECGHTFTITAKQQQGFKDKDMHLPTRCINCRHKNRNFEYKPCKDCGEPFQITELEKEWYKKRGFEEPERCTECREKRRKANG